MNCAYHTQNGAVIQCNGCGKSLCPACDHRIKGFPYCQDCIVMGVDLLRQQNSSNSGYAPYVRKNTSPFIAFILSVVPGLGAAYNGQTVKALVYFGVFIGLFQLAILSGIPLFFFGALGMWAFAGLDAWRTARMIRSGITPDVAEDVLVRRFQGNPKLWGILLSVLGLAFLLQNVFGLRNIMRGLLPAMLIGFGIYILRGYIFKPKDADEKWSDFDSARPAPIFSGKLFPPKQETGNYGYRSTETSERRFGNWGDR